MGVQQGAYPLDGIHDLALEVLLPQLGQPQEISEQCAQALAVAAIAQRQSSERRQIVDAVANQRSAQRTRSHAATRAASSPSVRPSVDSRRAKSAPSGSARKLRIDFRLAIGNGHRAWAHDAIASRACRRTAARLWQ